MTTVFFIDSDGFLRAYTEANFQRYISNNPRFPHSIVISRVVRTTSEQVESSPWDSGDPDTVEVIEIIYNGEGRNYKDGVKRGRDNVVLYDFGISIPYTEIELKKGDKVEVMERNRLISGFIQDSYLGNLGLNVYWNSDSN